MNWRIKVYVEENVVNEEWILFDRSIEEAHREVRKKIDEKFPDNFGYQLMAQGHWCERCGKEEGDLVNDPYQRDMYDRDVEKYLCHDCYSDIAGDI